MEDVQMEQNKEETDNITYFEPIKIKQDKKTYILNIEVNEETITLSIKEQLSLANYSRNMNYKEIKNLNKIFNSLNSCDNFYEYLKELSNNDKINIENNNNNISIFFYIEDQLKEQKVEIVLYQTKIDTNLCLKEIYNELLNLKEKIKEIDYLKEENINLKKVNQNLKIKIDENTKNINQIKNENKDLKMKIEEQKKEINDIKNNIIIDKFENIISKIIKKNNFSDYNLIELEKIIKKLREKTKAFSSLNILKDYFDNYQKYHLNKTENENNKYVETKIKLYNFVDNIVKKLCIIAKFRKDYKILENDATDEEIENYLRKFGGDEQKTYEALMQRYIK